MVIRAIRERGERDYEGLHCRKKHRESVQNQSKNSVPVGDCLQLSDCAEHGQSEYASADQLALLLLTLTGRFCFCYSLVCLWVSLVLNPSCLSMQCKPARAAPAHAHWPLMSVSVWC